MHLDGYAFMLDTCARFFSSLRLDGWFHHPDDGLTGVALIGPVPQAGVLAQCGMPHAGVQALGADKGFSLQALFLEHPANLEGMILRFTTRQGHVIDAPLGDLVSERVLTDDGSRVARQFYAQLESQPDARVLDLGGRHRSGGAGSVSLPGRRAVVFDWLPGPDVDVTGDAHRLSSFFPRGVFDAIICVSVFEHLALPWKAAVEMNRVLRPGGLALIHSHQTLGMHDMPWDFWRFSDEAWRALFNEATGFHIVDRVLALPMFLIPVWWHRHDVDAERTRGFEGSTVLVRKVGEAHLDWDQGVADLLTSTYPA